MAHSVDSLGDASLSPLGAGYSNAASGPHSGLLDSLVRATNAAPIARKRLVGPDINYCREILVALARVTGGWVGWESATLRTIATELALVPMSRQGRRAGTDIEINALVEQTLDDAVSKNENHAFRPLQRGLGFRRAVIDAVLELRTAGVAPEELRFTSAAGGHASEIADVLSRYQEILAVSGLCDPAEVLRLAIAELDSNTSRLGSDLLFVPGSSARGLRGQLIDRLLARGGRVLTADAVSRAAVPAGILSARGDLLQNKPSLLSWSLSATSPSPDDFDPLAVTFDLFASSTPSIELTEVLRRASAEGLPWDEVEIATTDPDTYGIALDALCQRVDMRATMLHGIPITRTRLGRALERWLNWLDGDLPASILREALEAGDTRPSNSGASAAVLARELRRLRIGWGLTRYQQAARDLEQQSVSPSVRRYEDESDEEFGQRTERRRRIAVALHDFVQDLLVCLPETSGDGTEQGRYSCGDLAAATLRWTRLLSVDDGPESLTLDRLRSRLEQLVKVGGPPSEMAIAVASLRESLADLRAWPAQTSDRKPWSANGGMVHLTDIRHAGITGRRRIFVVGLDARRASSGRRSDPLLTDELRTQLGGNRLPTLDDRRNESAFALASALAALRGRVTLSYAVSDGGDRPEASPAPVLLQSLRLMRADPSLSYRELRAELSPPISAVPTPTSLGKPAPLDRRDVWLDTVAKGSLLLDARNLAREGFPGLSGGLLAAERSQAPEANEYHGVIARAAAAFDPLCTPGREMSPSELEKLAVCPLQWFYVYGLALKPPHDPEYDPDRWLDAMQRGSLLHDVYQSFVTEYRGRQSDIQAPEARDHILRMVDVAIAEYREIVPVPGDSVFAAEADELRSAAMTFLEMERELGRNGDGAEWLDVEFAFGRLTKPAAYRLVDGRELRVRGRADRVDRLTNGTLRVVDYKTGSTWAYKKDSKVGPFRGGRQLQPTVYAAVIQSLLGADVSSFEYRFPTAKGVGQITSYPAVDLQIGQSIVSDYIGLVRSGQFIPTNDSSDCKYCDASQICRVGRDDDGWVEVSPRAAWAKANGETIEAYSIMRKHRLPPVK